MYNLLVVYGEGTWDGREFVVPADRYLQYTVPNLQSRFKSLDDTAIADLTAMPALFTYEERGNLSENTTPTLNARVGRITSIKQRQSGIAIAWELSGAMPSISQSALSNLYHPLDIDRGRRWSELTTTHWAVKDVELLKVLSESGIVSNTSPLRAPTVFISYSWDSDEHLAWVRKLADHLRDQGIDAKLDQTHLRLGQDISPFMEEIQRCDRVIVVCSPSYMTKANDRTGGAGYEYRMVVNELLADSASTKFIPVLRDAVHRELMPASLKGRLFLELGSQVYGANLARLVKELHGIHTVPKPLGPRPIF